MMGVVPENLEAIILTSLYPASIGASAFIPVWAQQEKSHPM